MDPWGFCEIRQGKVFEIDVLKEIGKKYGKNEVQVVLRWDLQRGVATIPKSVSKERIEQNADIFDFELSGEDMAAIDALDHNHRLGFDPMLVWYKTTEQAVNELFR